MSYAKKPLKYFLERLGSSDISPGGGSAAALALALGVSLAEMTARINQKRRGATGDSRARIAYLARERRGALRLMDLDEKVFRRVSVLYKKDKESDVYQRALKQAAAVPFEMCNVAANVLVMARKEKPRTSRWLASDLAEAGVLLYAAFKSARLNVEINLALLRDKAYARKVIDWLEREERRMKDSDL